MPVGGACGQPWAWVTHYRLRCVIYKLLNIYSNSTDRVEAASIAPSYLDVLDLHEYTKVDATEKLRAKICELKPLKHSNHLMVITGKGQHGEYACIKGHVRQLLDGAWHASYIVKRAGDGKGTDGFYVKITKKLKKDVKNAKDSQLSPTRPTVVVRPRVVHAGN